MARIGYLGSSSPSLEPHYVEAFRTELRNLGYVEGQHITIAYRWAEGKDERLPDLAAALVRLNPDVIVTTGTPGALAAKQATRTIPIVMASAGDPVRTGLVASLARPGGNVTGYTILGSELEGKRLELLKQVVPTLSPLAVLWNSANPAIYEQAHLAARVLNVTLHPVVEVRVVADLENVVLHDHIGAAPGAHGACRSLLARSPNADRRIRGQSGGCRGCTRTGSMWRPGDSCRIRRARSSCSAVPAITREWCA